MQATAALHAVQPDPTGDDPAAWVRRYTRDHQENFSVLSWLLPRRLRGDFAAVYAFCRWSDDLADEAESPDAALTALRDWRAQLDACLSDRLHPDAHPIFRALRPTIEQHDLPGQPFHDLLDAFEMDQRVTRYDTYEQLLDYCRLSANPVGRLVLFLGGYRDTPEHQARFAFSDATCTALQLINHIQDIRRDVLERDRVYVPNDVALQHNVDVEQLARMIRDDAHPPRAGEADCPACATGSAGLSALVPNYRAALADLCDRVEALFAEGRKLWPMLDRDSGIVKPVKAFTLGGEAVLRRVRRMNFDTPRRRPRLSKATKAGLLFRVATGAVGR
ncbi:MAG: squalene/phytoene synthase family protein [Planctomycetota bacterium]